MLRETNKNIDTYIPFTFHFGTNYGERPDLNDLAKDCLRLVVCDYSQSTDTGHIIGITNVDSFWLHTASTGISTMDIAVSMSLYVNQEIPIYNLQEYGKICIDIDIIKAFRNLIVYTDYNKYDIDPTILWDRINFADSLSYRFYDRTPMSYSLNYEYNSHHYIADSDIYDAPPHRIKSAGITVDTKGWDSAVLVPIVPTKIEFIRISFNTTMHIMSDIFDIKNLDLMKKKNLKIKYIISLPKYNKINLGGGIDMLRDTYKSDYIRYAVDIGSFDANVIKDTKCIWSENGSKLSSHITDFYLHISTLNNNTVSIAGYINVHFDDTAMVTDLYDDVIIIHVDVCKIIENKDRMRCNIKYVDDDFDHNIFYNTDNTARIYGSGLFSYDTQTIDSTTYYDNPYDTVIINIDKSGTFSIGTDDPLVWYTNKTVNDGFFSNNAVVDIHCYFNFNLQFYHNVFDHKLHSLKKNLKVYYLNNIKHLQNYYIN